VVSGNVVEAVGRGAAISAGPGGGRHVITGNRVLETHLRAMSIRAQGSLVESNLEVR
jgi:hypothetical protein